MINTHALSIACMHLNNDLKQPEINKLKKQKHAAHQANYRLNKQLEKLQLEKQILSQCIIAVSVHNRNLCDIITKYNEGKNE